MTLLDNYASFDGIHWETGSTHNFFDYRGFKAPHTKQTYSEPLLLGVSGGIVFGYFSFAYEGWDPILALLTRNTFDPMEKMLSRLGVMQNIKQTAKPEKALKNLQSMLDDGTPAVAWIDIFNTSYVGTSDTGGIPGMSPVVVYGMQDGHVHLADRAKQGFVITEEEFLTAWGAVKKNKYKLATYEAPAEDKLAGAVSAGIWDTINLFTEKPPKGSKNNFGFAAYQHWIKLLTKPKTRLSWEKEFPRGVKHYSALSGAFTRTSTFGQAQAGADRRPYADFLREAATILEKPDMTQAADTFLESADAWEEMGQIVLPDSAGVLHDARQLLAQKRDVLRAGGPNTGEEITEINGRLAEIRSVCESDFPLSQAEVEAQRQQIAEQAQRIHDIELTAITQLKSIMI
ncbi:MAG: BtrH N-terminal domain-containing protein [Chloroflexota bacterium]